MTLTAEDGRNIADPVKFQRIGLGRTLWQKQREILQSIMENPLTAVKGCHASGKTYVVAGEVPGWLIRHRKGKVFITAPTLRQVKTFWGEISTCHTNSPFLRQLLPAPTTTALKLNQENYAFGASSSRGVNIQGLHGEDVLIICDESPGILPEIWDAIEGIRAGGNVRLVRLGNPVVPVGEFFDCFGRNRAINSCISISALDTPNFQDETTGEPITLEELMTMSEERLSYAPYPFLITRRWVKERYIVWGPNHPKFRSRVLAEFPQQSPYSVFEMAWIERAKRDPTDAERKAMINARAQVGIDVAGPGDDQTVLYARVNGVVVAFEAWHEADPIGGVLRKLHEIRKQYGISYIVVDVTGIGYHFARRIAENGFSEHVYGFNASQSAIQSDMYANGKSEAYFTCREYLRDPGDSGRGLISGLNDDETEAQLVTMLYRETGRGLTEIRSKEDMRKLGVPSPDRAEAFIFAFMRVVPRTVEVSSELYRISPI